MTMGMIPISTSGVNASFKNIILETNIDIYHTTPAQWNTKPVSILRLLPQGLIAYGTATLISIASVKSKPKRTNINSTPLIYNNVKTIVIAGGIDIQDINNTRPKVLFLVIGSNMYLFIYFNSSVLYYRF
jgi:hypothetical protein